MKKMISNQPILSPNIEVTRYQNGQLAVFVKDEDGEPLAELSHMSDSVSLAPDEFLLKDYSENEELAEILIKSGLISQPDRFILIGSRLFPICHMYFKS